MLSYQHEYHAGNHADVLKHCCLVQMMESLCKKEKPFTVIDIHAGAGVFSLGDERIAKTGEAERGILLLCEYARSHPVHETVSQYLLRERPYIDAGRYAGSPELVRLFLRQGDSHHVVEKHPAAFSSLKNQVMFPVQTPDGIFRAQAKTIVHNADSYLTLNALVPPQIKRGLVLIDPSYEDTSDYHAVSDAVRMVHKKWNTAIIAVWYPLIERRRHETAQLLTELEHCAKLGTIQAEYFKIEMEIKNTAQDSFNLNGSGMFILNAPWKLDKTMEGCVECLSSVF